MDEQRVREIARELSDPIARYLVVVLLVLGVFMTLTQIFTVAELRDLQRRVGSLEQQLEQKK